MDTHTHPHADKIDAQTVTETTYQPTPASGTASMRTDKTSTSD